MKLPVLPPFAPMEAQLAARLPTGGDWLYEPKWDGFRCLVFRDGAHIHLQSKAGKPLARYFPELIGRLLALDVPRFVLDGEIVVPVKGVFSFDDLLQRIHPAESRINRLSRERPADLIVFDLLVTPDGTAITGEPLSQRRPRLETFTDRYFGNADGIALSPATQDVTQARAWLDSPDINLDGVMAKRLDLPYRAGDRTGMRKIKRKRTADCVVGGFRYSGGSQRPSAQREIGSLLLGLYDTKGLLHHVGFCSGLSDSERKDLVERLEPLIQPPGFSGSAPGGPSRWRREGAAQWQPLSPRLVVEVEWDHFTGGRFRHGTRFLRWRPDKPPVQCTMAQVRAG